MPHAERTYGPLPKGYVDIHIDLPRADRDWAKRQPEGVSALVRRLLAAERARREGLRREDTP